ncbi:MAG TPA: hypothetical protein VG097_03070 [Gemmata sp.]|jgi:hypothetical protein|nr:hypothetical protein [Gemmata sp.]
MFWAFLTFTAVGLFWLGYRHPRRRRWWLLRRVASRLSISAVDCQHKHLLAGGRFGEAAVAAVEARFRELLRNGPTNELEREFSSALKDLTNPLARPALRAIARVARGCRDSAIDPGRLLAIGVGDILAKFGKRPLPHLHGWESEVHWMKFGRIFSA